MANAIKDIIRKYLSRENTTEITRCSRDTQGAEHEINLPKEEFEMLRFSDSVTFRCGNEYVSLYMGEDEATREYKIVDDGWIPVDERLPEEPKENPEFEGKEIELYLVTVKGAKYPFRAMWNRKFFTDGWSKCNVIAWRPLPEPYRMDQERSVE